MEIPTEREVVARYGQVQADYEKQFGDRYLSATLGYERSVMTGITLRWARTLPTTTCLFGFNNMNSFNDRMYEARADI